MPARDRERERERESLHLYTNKQENDHIRHLSHQSIEIYKHKWSIYYFICLIMIWELSSHNTEQKTKTTNLGPRVGEESCISLFHNNMRPNAMMHASGDSLSDWSKQVDWPLLHLPSRKKRGSLPRKTKKIMRFTSQWLINRWGNHKKLPTSL